MPTNMPDMGMDYGLLAKLMAPQMMPNAPVGAGGMAGQMFYEDKARQDQALQQATSLAQLDAMMKANAADEYGQGRPGRVADIQTNNALSEGKLKTLPDLLSKQTEDAQAGAIKARQEKINSILKEAEPWSNDWAQADEEGRKELRDQMKKQGVKIGGKSIDDIPDEKLDRVMNMARERQINTPAQIQKESLEKIKGQNAYSREYLKQTMANERANIRAEAMKEVKKMGGKTDKFEVDYEKRKSLAFQGKGEFPTPEEDEMYNVIQINKQMAIRARAEAAPPQIDVKKLEGVPLEKPPVPSPARMPKSTKTYKGKKVIDEGTEKGTGRKYYKLEDDSIVPVEE